MTGLAVALQSGLGVRDAADEVLVRQLVADLVGGSSLEHLRNGKRVGSGGSGMQPCSPRGPGQRPRPVIGRFSCSWWGFMVYLGDVSETEPIDYEALRQRFPWVGLVDEPAMPVAARYREIIARPDRPTGPRCDRRGATQRMTGLLCDSGPLIASYNRADPDHERCLRLLGGWPGRLLVPEPVLGETCNFLRNSVRNGPDLEVRFLHAVLDGRGDFDIVDPVPEDRRRAVELADRLVTAPAGYVDAMVIAMAERLRVPDIATIDYKMIGMMNRCAGCSRCAGCCRRAEAGPPIAVTPAGEDPVRHALDLQQSVRGIDPAVVLVFSLTMPV